MSRERMHHAIDTTDMGWSDIKVKDIDLLTAMGFASGSGELEALGGDLLIIRTATRSKSLFYIPGNDLYKQTEKNACEALSEVSRHHRDIKSIRRDQRQYLAALAVTEWINDACPTCEGRGSLKRDDGTVVITCLTCKGSKKRRYSDKERIETMRAGHPEAKAADIKARYLSTWERALMVMHGIIGLAERAHQRKTMDWADVENKA